MTSQRSQALSTIASLASVTLLVGVCAKVLVDTPVVVEQPGGNCLRVMSPNPAHSCGNLPSRYVRQHSWK